MVTCDPNCNPDFRVIISEAMNFSEIRDMQFREVEQVSDKVTDKIIQYLWRYYDR